MKKMKRRSRSEKEVVSMSLRKFREEYLKKDKDNPEDTTKLESKIARDLTVQRKRIWTYQMLMDYFSEVAIGNADNNPLHYCDLNSSIRMAEKQGSFHYGRHLNEFAMKGNVASHVDGGNRTDSLILTLTDKIPVMKGYYDFGVQEDGSVLYFTLDKDTNFSKLDSAFQDAILDNGEILVCTYYGLSKVARKELFIKLNDGVPLIDPELRNSEESDVCEINRNYDLELSENNIMVKVKALTQAGTERWRLAEFFAKLKYAKRHLITFSKTNEVQVKWASSKDIDEDYKVNSSADKNAKAEQKFIVNTYMPYLKLLLEDENALPESALYIDLFLVLSYMDKKSINITYPINNDKRRKFLQLFSDMWVKYASQKKKTYISKYTYGKPVYVEFSQLISKSSDLTLTQRLQKYVDEFVMKSKLFTKVTSRSTNSPATKARILVAQKGKTKISGTKISSLEINTPKIEIDHNEDVRGGGADEDYNKSHELARENSKKGAIRVPA